MLSRAGEGVSPGRDAEPVPEPFGDREPGHHECGAVCALLEAADGLVEENAVDLGGTRAVQRYAEAKTAVISAILARAQGTDGPPP